MSKEYLEAFGRITLHTEYDNDGSYDSLNFEDDCKLVDEALERLESIDNSNPSEALECLEKLKGMEISSMPFSDEYGTQEVDLNDIRKVGSQLNTDFREYTATIKQALLKAQEQEKENELLKEIIKRY